MTKVLFVCTNRGEHREVRLGHSFNWSPVIFSRRARNAPDKPFWDEDGNWIGRRSPGMHALKKMPKRSVLPAREITFVEYVTTWGNPLEPDGTEFRCPKCARNPQITTELLRTAMSALKAAEITLVDISRLPF